MKAWLTGLQTYSTGTLLAACSALERHHSKSTLPPQVRSLLKAQMAQNSTGWWCGACRRSVKMSANFCPSCGQNWQTADRHVPYTATEPSTPWGGWKQHPKSPWERQPSPRQRGKGSNPERQHGKGGKKGKHKTTKGAAPEKGAAEAAPQVPTLTSLPKPPSMAVTPTPATAAPTPAGPSSTENTLQQILQALNRSRDELPQAVRDILDTQVQEDTKAQAKSLHRLVAAQGQDYVRECAAYVTSICELWKAQLEEKGKAMAAFLDAEAQWEQQYIETSQTIAKIAADPDNQEAIDVDAMDEEDTKISDLAQAEVQRQATLENMRQAEVKITESLQAASKSVEQQATEMGRQDRERSSAKESFGGRQGRARLGSQKRNHIGSQRCGPGDAARCRKSGRFTEAAAAICCAGCWLGPSLSSTLSLPGDVERCIAGLSACERIRHSIECEWDYTSPWMASLLGLRCHYEVTIGDIGVHSDLVLDRRQLVQMTGIQ